MNKKIKISLLGVLLTSSLAGVATTIASCSASELPELNETEITGIIYKTNSYEKVKETIKTELNKAMDAAIIYQDKFALYTQWTQGINIPTGINDVIYAAIQFIDANNAIVTFNDVFDKFTITTMGEYPVGPNAPLPNMIVTPKIKPQYYIDPVLLDKNLKFSDIPFTSKTGKIKLGVGFKGSIIAALGSQLSKDLSIATTYQERKMIFNNWNNSEGEMKPDSISQDAKEVILSNITLYKFGYSSPSTLDDFFSKISIVPWRAGVYPNDLITDLPEMKLVLDLDEHKFVNPESKYQFDIKLSPLIANSGVGEFDFTFSSTLEKDMTNLFTDELNGDYAPNKAKYESWNSYNSLPVPVKNALEAGISFNSNIDITNVNTFANIIDTEKTVITKGVFPGVNTGEIEPIQIKLVLKPGRFVKIDGSLVSEFPPINISNLPNAEATAYITDEKEFPKIREFIRIIEDSMKSKTFEEKKNIYNSYTTFENLPQDAITKIDSILVQNFDSNEELLLKTILESKIISKGTFPSAEGQPIPSIIVELKLDKASKMSQDGKYYKILPIEIKFDGITS